MKNIDMEIRRHTLILERLNSIKEMELILEGKSIMYKKYMNDKTFLDGVKHRLEIEISLLDDLKTMEI